MQEEKRSGATVWIIVIAILGLLFVCMFGMLFGGIAGYALGRITAPAALPPEFRIEPEPFPPEPPIRPETERGALVTQVIEGSPADLAGIQPGDILLTLDSMSLGRNELVDLLMRYGPGDQIELTLSRGGRVLTVTVILGENPDRRGVAWLGIVYQQLPS